MGVKIPVWLLAGLALCGGCDQKNPHLNSQAATPRDKVQSYTSHTVTVTLNEGTNLALAARPGHPQRVLALQGSLFLVHPDGQVQPLTSPYYDAREPQLSPDGRLTVFQGYRNGNWDIWQVDHQGGEPQALTRDLFDDREPQYSADGQRVVFSSDRGGSYDIWQLNVATGELLQLTESEGDSYSPSLSADGRLAFAQQLAGTSRIVVQGAEPQVVAEEVGTLSGVQWSADMRYIAYQVQYPNGSRLKLLNLSNKLSKVMSADTDDVFPFRAQWLDEDQIAYTVNGRVRDQQISTGTAADWPFAITLELERHNYTRRQRNYDPDLFHPVLGIINPQVNSDGTHIYFGALGDLWHWQPAQKVLERLTDDQYADHSLALSPDNTQLAFVSDRNGKPGLYLLDIGQGRVRPLAVEANLVSLPAWSPDGKQLAFFVDVPGNPLGGQLVVMELATGSVKPVLKPMPAQPISWSPDGRRVAVTRLKPYSSRYREGVYALVIADLDSGDTHEIIPQPHQSIVSAGLTPDGAMSYVVGGRLWRLELDANFRPLESAGTLTRELTDMPAWDSTGSYVVYLNGGQLKRLAVNTGVVTDITPPLTYQRDAPSGTHVIRAGRVFDGTDEDYIDNVDIWVVDNKIQQIVPAADAVPVDVRFTDASRYAVVPGLFEMHAHMGEVSEVQGRVWLSYGVTTVRDPGANPYVAKARQETWDSAGSVGPRTHITGYLADGNRVYYSIAEGIVSETHLMEALARTAGLRLDFIKTYVRLPDHWQRQVVDFAHGRGMPVTSHELYPAVAHGVDHVEHIGGTSRRGYQPKVSRLGYAYQDVVELLTASGMGMTATAVLPGFAVVVGEQPDWFDTPQFAHFYGPPVRRLYDMMLPRMRMSAGGFTRANARLLKTLTQDGALLVTGTDAPFVPYGAGLHAELRLFARAGISPADVLRQATVDSARAAGVSRELGTLEPGKLADFVILDGDPLADIADLDNVVATVKNGRYYSLAELLNPAQDEAAIRAAALPGGVTQPFYLHAHASNCYGLH